MDRIERIGISLDRKLLAAFDRLIARQGYQNRSEAVRDLIRSHISEKRLQNPRTRAVAAILVVYDHHSAQLMEKLTHLQHQHLLHTISSMHIHLAREDCLEIIVLRGRVGQINKMAEKLVSLKGVKLGRINLVTADPP